MYVEGVNMDSVARPAVRVTVQHTVNDVSVTTTYHTVTTHL